jgi:hypothetical protein
MRTARFFLLALLVLSQGAAHAGIRLIARASIPGTAADRSGLTGTLENGVPANRLGGFGSAIAYTGGGSTFIALSDRGPNAKPYDPAVDNTTSYASRFHTFRLALRQTPGAALPYALDATLVSTTLLRMERGGSFTGRSDAFEPGRPSSWAGNARLDPEGLRVSRDRRGVFIADEYGPYLYRFDRANGKRTAAYALPDYYAVAKPGPAGRSETTANVRGRVANRGMEGLAITPDGKALVGIMQSPLIQDGGVGGLQARLVAIDVASGARREYVYALDNGDNMLSEILAVNQREFLVVERDGLEGAKAAFKRIYRIGLAPADDVAGREALPAAGVRPVSKSLFIDLLDPRHGLAGAGFPARIEGLAFGPDVVMQGRKRRTLYVTSDNDYLENEPTELFVFAIDASDLRAYRPQRFRP